MSWQITEDHDLITFRRFFPEREIMVEIQLDHGPDSTNIFDGHIVDKDNKSIFQTSGVTFYEVFDKLMNGSYAEDSAD